ncbi:hypothetical protein AOQ84DRAFT_226774 [Glonium stellatum]|uniref:Uncharacterized protein n=1 Tax=Glonium stellatum TaxID=574774 RepID=A0A8E2JXK4_9PEZI|nr:hypothetical protein AOQ84DRAFT_226774 [Glonium stellatum]
MLSAILSAPLVVRHLSTGSIKTCPSKSPQDGRSTAAKAGQSHAFTALTGMAGMAGMADLTDLEAISAALFLYSESSHREDARQTPPDPINIQRSAHLLQAPATTLQLTALEAHLHGEIQALGRMLAV